MTNTFLNWIKQNYFKGQFSLVTFHEVEMSWEIICRNFQSKKESLDSEDSELMIGVGEESITVNSQNPSGLRDPNGFIFSSSEITLNGRSLSIATNIWVSDYFEYFSLIWKGGVFVVSVIALPTFIIHIVRGSFEPSTLLSAFVVLVFNSICWLFTFFMKAEAKSEQRWLMNILNED